MKITILLLAITLAGSAYADVRYHPSDFEPRDKKRSYPTAAAGAALAAAIAAAGVAVAKKLKKDKKTTEPSPEECVIDQDNEDQ